MKISEMTRHGDRVYIDPSGRLWFEFNHAPGKIGRIDWFTNQVSWIEKEKIEAQGWLKEVEAPND